MPSTLPAAIDLRALGVERAALTRVEAMYHQHGSSLYRLCYGERSVVLKYNPYDTGEVQAYRLLMAAGVPTVAVLGMSANALLLEDLAASPQWRLATVEDVAQPEVGAAVATWYRTLHAAGDTLSAQGQLPAWLHREVDALLPASLAQTAQRLGLAGLPVWRLVEQHLGRLQRAFRRFPETLNYNDFYWSNLALTRVAPLRAVVFDYHLLGRGPAYSDVRNVQGSLGTAARDAFLAAYGPVDDAVAVFDRPLAQLYRLQVTARVQPLPAWAQACVRQVQDGTLERYLQQALGALTEA